MVPYPIYRTQGPYLSAEYFVVRGSRDGPLNGKPDLASTSFNSTIFIPQHHFCYILHTDRRKE